METYEALMDGCDGDTAGLLEALGENYRVVKSTGSNYGYGHHSYNTIYQASDGRYVSAECGGCSCGGSGSWCYSTLQEAERMIPEQER
jgi:hypothetical protein